jgi:hypothetical protein
MAQSVKNDSTCVLSFSFEGRSHIFAIHNAKIDEAGQEVVTSKASYEPDVKDVN